MKPAISTVKEAISKQFRKVGGLRKGIRFIPSPYPIMRTEWKQ